MKPYNLQIIFTILLIHILSAVVFAQTEQKPLTREEIDKRVKINTENRIKEYENFIKEIPENEDVFRQEIVRLLIYSGAPTKRVLEKVGKGFKKPQKKLYFEIAKYLTDRKEHLDKAVEFLRLEESVPYIWRGNDAYIPPCLWCVEAEIYFHKKKFQKTIDLIEPHLPSADSKSLFGFGISLELNYKLLAAAYVETGRLDDAVKLYLRVVSENMSPAENDRQTLNELYQKRFGGLDGLEKIINEKNKLWRYDVFIKPNLVSVPVPQITLPDIYGKNVSLSSFSGKVMIVLVFPIASSFGQDNIRIIKELVKANEKVVFIAIDTDYYYHENYQRLPFTIEQRREKIIKSFGDIKPDFPILLATESTFSHIEKSFGFLISMADRNGNIRFRRVPQGKPYFTEMLNYLLNSESVR